MDAPTTILSIDLIVSNPNVRGGRPVIRGTTIPVADIAIVKIHHRQDADGLAEWFGLSLPQVYAALSYYYDHQAEIDADIRTRREQLESIKAETQKAEADERIWEQKLASTQPQLDVLADKIRLQVDALKKRDQSGD